MGADTIWFELDVPTACPIMGYAPCAKMEAQAGYGIQWVRENFGIEPEIIDMRQQKHHK